MMFAHVSAGSDLVVPSINWVALSPIVAMFAGALVLLGISALVPRRLSSRVWGLLGASTAAVSTGLAVWVWNRVLDGGEMVTAKGAVVVDGFATMAIVIIGVSTALTCVVLADFLDGERLAPLEPVALVLLSATGAMAMVTANDLMVAFLGLEIMSIAVYVLASANHRRLSSAEAGLKYFLLGSFASAVFLYGIAMTYGATGSINLDSISKFLAGTVLTHTSLLAGGIGLMLAGFAFKIAAAPFHSWAPDVYEGAPTPVTGFMASTVKVAAFATPARVFVRAMGSQLDRWQWIVGVLAAATLIVGGVMAIVQTNAKRILAYSSIGHAGFMLAAVFAASDRGNEALLVYGAIYSLMAVGSFAVLSLVRRSGDSGFDLDSLAGLGNRRPAIAIAFTILLMAQAGVPVTGGFVAKLGVIRALTDRSYWWLAIVAMLSAVISAFLYLRLIGTMFFTEASEADAAADAEVDARSEPLTAVVIWACVVGVIATGVLGSLVTGIGELAVMHSPFG